MSGLPTITLDGRSITPEQIVQVARGRAEAALGDEARARNAAAERLVRELIDRGELLYGVTTGVGVLRSRPSAPENRGDFQWRLLRSHAGGGGAPLIVEVVRAAMAVRANQLGAGGAGVGDALIDALLGALRAGVTPFARELGSLGTGDLTVLAEIGLALGGEGECWVGDDVVPAAEALAAHGLTPVHYGPRDGIGFMSSNAVSIGQASIVFTDARKLLDSALAVAALSYEAAGGDLAVLDPRVHEARPHNGQVEVARRLRVLLGGIEPRSASGHVQDAFVFRCVPQVEGTLLDALGRLSDVLEIEINVAGENALMLPGDGVALPNGNFHAGVLTLALDSLRGAMAQSASLMAARVSALLDPDVTGLNAQLAARPGPRLRRDDPRVHGARGRRRGPLAGGDGGVADHDGAVGRRVARELRRPLGAPHLRRAGPDGGGGLGRAGAGGARAAAARDHPGRPRRARPVRAGGRRARPRHERPPAVRRPRSSPPPPVRRHRLDRGRGGAVSATIR